MDQLHEAIKFHDWYTGAAFIWLKNRSNWKDKQEVEHSGEVVTFNMDFDNSNQNKDTK